MDPENPEAVTNENFTENSCSWTDLWRIQNLVKKNVFLSSSYVQKVKALPKCSEWKRSKSKIEHRTCLK